MSEPSSILIIGASGRAAAAMAIRQGQTPFVIDLFNDEDTKRLASCLRIPFEHYPNGFIELAKLAPPGPFMYTGALENYPDVIETIARERALVGNGLNVLAEVRDPIRLAKILPGDTPRYSLEKPKTGDWLVKPKAGAAGIGIQPWDRHSDCPPGCFFQEAILGTPMSALFFHDRLLGITEQLIGCEWLHAPVFRYAGNIGPLPGLDDTLIDHINAMGQTLVKQTQITGDWGMDFMLTEEGQPVVLEINPRCTAARELFDWADMTETHTVFGKCIYYAPSRIVFPIDGPWTSPCDVHRRPDYADIPEPGAIHEAGQPVISLTVEGASADDCRNQLRAKVKQLESHFKS